MVQNFEPQHLHSRKNKNKNKTKQTNKQTKKHILNTSIFQENATLS